MFNKLSVKSIVIEYKKSFENKNKKIPCLDNFIYFYLPYIIAFILCLIKLPDDNLINLFGTSLSIFIGFFLSIIAILLSFIGTKKIEINYTEQKLRLEILKDTIYSILYAIIQSVKALIILYLLNIITLDKSELGELFYILFEKNIDFFIQFTVSIFLYKYNISLIFAFYIIIKNIVALFKNDIDIEMRKIKEEEKNTN